MITVKQESKLLEKIKSMTELEFTTFFEELADHIEKQNWEHIVERHFTRVAEVEQELEDSNSSLEACERDNHYLNNEIRDYQLKLAVISEKLDDLISVVK